MVDVPDEDEKKAFPLEKDPSLVHIRSSSGAPKAPYVDVKYRGHHFYIEDTDLQSKRAFTFLSILFSFVESGPQLPPTLVTVPG